MSTPTRVWISENARQRLQSELGELRALLDRDALDDDAVDSGKADENLIAIQRARQSRIQQIHDLLVNAVVGEDPPDDGIAEPGMVLTVRYDDTGDTETFLLGVRGTEHGDVEIYSLQSPLGEAILGARPGQQRTYRTPAGTTVAVTLLAAVPYGLHQHP
ncbi:transcription elongation factor GreA [Mycolicibacterium cyprinidarum]|uniref:Transcription elongation factor GreA n=1 Tax=Mycolicibacterium cyprinidarum TaxID=2860311 RepID=A0ABQ4V2X2_9MYCO|nr:transcription elongation factor GreA [Mycolicibacterium sp. NGTWSNA01]GJF12130.1 transcription elongation factor GreA [Mycolicibacterium sp. NGTWS1803]GJF13124.1 transcription elongation factor GreA [Mycolicibacterium sp. NGTWS0302]